MSDLMCVFCEGVFTDTTYVCPNCDDYKGLMPIGKAIDYLDLNPADYQ